MFPFKRFFSALAPLLAIVLLAASCNTDSGGDEPPQRYGPKIAGASLIGPNLDPDDGYIFEASYGDYYFIAEAGGDLQIAYDDNYGGGFTGTIVGDVAADRSLFSCKWGYITIRIDSVLGYWSLTPGFYYVIHWKDMDSSGLVNVGGAYRAGSSYNNGMSTRAAAKAEYTVENGYFGLHALYNIHL